MSETITRETLIQRSYDFDPWEIKVARFFLKTRQRSDFYSALAEMKAQGMGEPEAVVNEWKLKTRKGKFKSSKTVLALAALTGGFLGAPSAYLDVFLSTLIADMEEGDQLSTALCKWAPEFEQLMLSTQDGLNPESLRILAKDAGKIDEYRSTILSESKSIVIAVAMLFGTLWGAGHYFVPTIEKILTKDKMTPLLSFLVEMSKGFLDWQYLIIILTISFPILITWSLPAWTGSKRQALEFLPPYSIYKMWTGSVFLITLASLITTGRSIPNALKALNENAKPYISERLSALIAIDDCQLGEALDRIEYEWPDYETIHKISVYMHGDNAQQALVDVAEIQATNIAKQITKLAKQISTLGLIMSSVIIMIFSLSLMTIDPSTMGK